MIEFSPTIIISPMSQTYAILLFAAVMLCGIYVLACCSLPRVWRHKSLTTWVLAINSALLLAESIAVLLSTKSDIGAGITWYNARIIISSFLPGTWIVLSLVYARGQSLRFVGRWRWTILGFLLLPAIIAVFFADRYFISSQPITLAYPNLILGFAGQTIQVIIIAGCVIALMNLERTYRAAIGTLRWRVKYTLLGMATLLVLRFYTSSQAILFGSISPAMDAICAAGTIVSILIMLRGLPREGNLEIDLYPSHQVISNSITIILAGAYLFVVGVLAKAVTYFGGDVAFPIKALGVLVAIVLLATLLQSDRFQLSIRQFVSRHFKRPKYDYRKIWKRFTEEAAHSLQQDTFCQSLARLSSETFDVLSVSIWLFEEDKRRLRLQSSTIITDYNESLAQLIQHDFESLSSTFVKDSRPIDLENCTEQWARSFVKLNPKKFTDGGNRICVPMTTRNSLLGVMVLGDRVNGIPFSEEEVDVLASIGDHAASSLLNLQLSCRLIENRELEAFQKMATFFVHDLKNAASTLNMMVKNLPLHWNKPEFREDALRGISRTGDRINQLIERLGTMRKGLEINVRSCNFDTFIISTLSDWDTPPRIDLNRSLNCQTCASIDTEQLGKVIINLLINASEAMDEVGEIDIMTGIEGSHIYLKVKDDGCGMTPEFLEKRLFRPFQTTKQRGIGIGMFQSKMIVEAHGGQLSAESEEGKGATFSMVLPTRDNQTS